MIQCSHCGTQNRVGSKFCSDCGARLVQRSGLVCPMCGTPNTVENVFCVKCGARLVPLTVAPAVEKTPPPAPIKGLSLPAKPAEPVAPAAKVEPVMPTPADQSEDWLARLRTLTPEEEVPSPTPAAETPAPAREPAPAAETPAPAREPAPAVETPTLAHEPAPAAETPAPAREPAPAAETPAPAREPAPAVETPTLAHEPPPAADEISDWLAHLRIAPPVEESGSTAPLPPRADEIQLVEEDLPDWLRSMPAPSAPEPVPTVPEPAPTPIHETPDWMERLHEKSEPATPMPAPTSDDEIPDWLKGEPAAPAVEEPAWFKPVSLPPQASPPVPASEGEIPDWLKLIKPREEEPAAAVSYDTPVDDSPSKVVSPGEELLKALEAAASTATPGEAAAPSWLTHTTREAAEEEYLPDWLRTPVAGESQPTPDVSKAVTTIEPSAQVPDWIAALKPVEQPAPDVFERGPVETSGPLAGLRGVLPLATAIIEPHAPPKPAPASSFQETAHLFESILAAPALASAAPTAPSTRRTWTMRPLIYLLLLLAILIPFFVPDLAISSLRTFGTPAADFYDMSQSVQPNSIVVLSFDYEPGSAGEMDLQANAVVRHLMQRRVKIAAISTLETGPQIAQRVLDHAARAAGNYTYGANYLNLGFVAGQEAGLAQLATAGFAATTRDYFKNQPLDKYPDFASLRNWRNVALLIEFAGAPEPLQKWLEQVQPRVAVRIAAGVSAAVEPRARAYRDAKQLTGFISGLVGAAQYEALSNQHGLALISAGAQSMAQLVLLGVIILGNLVYWFARGQGKAK